MIFSYPKKLPVSKKYISIIFDLGNVLVFFDEQKIKKILGNDASKISLEECKTIMTSSPYQQHAAGKITHTEAIARLYNFFSPEKIDIIKKYPISEALYPSKQSINVFNYIRSKTKNIFLLSNITPESFSHIAKSTPFVQQAAGYVVSYEVFCRKPDPNIFQILLNSFAIDPTTAIFFDDIDENCRAAYKLGIDSVIYNEQKNMLSFVKKLCLIANC